MTKKTDRGENPLRRPEVRDRPDRLCAERREDYELFSRFPSRPTIKLVPNEEISVVGHMTEPEAGVTIPSPKEADTR